MGIVHLQELLLDDITDQIEFGTAQLLRDNEGGDGGNKDHDDTAADAGHGQRKDDLLEDPEPIGTQIFGGLDDPLIHLLQGGIDGQNHKGEIVINKSQYDRKGVVADLQTDAGGFQPILQKIQKILHGLGAEHEVDPHGQHQKDHQNDLHPIGLLRHAVGQHIAQQEATDRRDTGVEQGAQEHRPVFTDLHHVGSCECAVCIGKCAISDHQNGNDDKDRRPDVVRDSNQLLFQFAVPASFFMIWIYSGMIFIPILVPGSRQVMEWIFQR